MRLKPEEMVDMDVHRWDEVLLLPPLGEPSGVTGVRGVLASETEEEDIEDERDGPPLAVPYSTKPGGVYTCDGKCEGRGP